MALIASRVRPGQLPSAKTQNEIIDVLTSLLRSSGANFFVDSQGLHVRAQPRALNTTTISITIDGSGAAITTSSPTLDGATIPAVPVGCTITGWAVETDQGGEFALDILRCTAADAAANPTSIPLTSIVGSGVKPGLTVTGNQYSVGAPSGWTSTQLAVGDVIGFSVALATTVQRVTVLLTVKY